MICNQFSLGYIKLYQKSLSHIKLIFFKNRLTSFQNMTSVEVSDSDNLQNSLYPFLGKTYTNYILHGPRKQRLNNVLRWFESSAMVLAYTIHELFRRPAVEWHIYDAIPTIPIDYSQLAQNDTCVLCKTKFRPLEAVKLLPCLHYYHDTCLANWCKENDDCPYRENEDDDERSHCKQNVHLSKDPEFLWRNEIILRLMDVLFQKHEFFREIILDRIKESVDKNLDVCAICLEQLQKKSKRLPCSHKFHELCVETWFERKNTCPLCRFKMEELL